MTRRNVSRYLLPREMPHLDAVLIPQVRKHASASLVESRSERTSIGIGKGATCIVSITGFALCSHDVGSERFLVCWAVLGAPVEGACAATAT